MKPLSSALSSASSAVALWILLSSSFEEKAVEAFFQSSAFAPSRRQLTGKSSIIPSQDRVGYVLPELRKRRRGSSLFASSSFYEESDSFDDEDDDDDDDLIDPDSLGDWRTFRRNLAAGITSGITEAAEGQPETTTQKTVSVSKENEDLLKTQNEELAKEYLSGVWAHTTSTPETGGLVVRMPLEAEIFKNFRHSITGRKLRQEFKTITSDSEPAEWYRKAQKLVEHEMMEIAEKAGEGGEIDASILDDESAELLQLYLDNQETWQEVCLVLERDEETGTASTLVLNRPMALKLTENLAQLVLHGAYQTAPKTKETPKTDLVKFMMAFGQECAVYIGGPDEQDQPAEIVHGIADLPGAVEIYPGSRIYCGGLDAAVDGVLDGKYKPLDFRFFVGRHSYDESTLDVSVVLGKYQPVACARALALKQCISLPKPLWHEVLELCGGEMKEISQLELSKREDVRFQIVDEDDMAALLDDEIPDELDELDVLDDDDDF